jgi:hypothetical protein
MNRRLFIKQCAASGMLAVTAGAGLLIPTTVPLSPGGES